MSERMTRQQVADGIYDLAVHNVNFYSIDGHQLEDAILAEFDALTADVDRLTSELELMRPVFEAAMVYVRHVRCRAATVSGCLITKHHALLEAGCKAMEEERTP